MHQQVILSWRGFTKTIPLLDGSNVTLFRSSAGYSAAMALMEDCPQPVCFDSHVIPNDESDDADENTPSIIRDRPTNQEGTRKIDENAAHITDAPDKPNVINDDLTSFDVELAAAAEELEEKDIYEQSPTNKLLIWHYRLNHLPFSRLQAMAKRGDLPSDLATCSVPQCAACNYAKATRRPWRTKGSRFAREIPTIKKAGDCVSVDQLESSTPGLIAQLRGFLTKERYNCATVFVDHHSGMSFIHLQKSTNARETLEAKAAFEAWSNTFGVQIAHYHADNGRFAERAFLSHCDSKGQTVSFAGVNAHHQNGVAEKRIRDLQDTARTMLVHAKKKWSKAVTPHLWPYALRTANDIFISTSRDNGPSPLERFSNVPIRPKINHFRPFGCPVYVLQGKLQAGQKGPKWDKRARVGLYLGPSPLHARSVALVLNVTTGLASPQFHCKFDNLFETTDSIDDVISWQTEAYFINGTTAASSQQPQRQVRITPPPNDVTIIPRPTAPSVPPTAPSEQPREMPANEGAPAPVAHLAGKSTTTKFYN